MLEILLRLFRWLRPIRLGDIEFPLLLKHAQNTVAAPIIKLREHGGGDWEQAELAAFAYFWIWRWHHTNSVNGIDDIMLLMEEAVTIKGGAVSPEKANARGQNWSPDAFLADRTTFYTKVHAEGGGPLVVDACCRLAGYAEAIKEMRLFPFLKTHANVKNLTGATRTPSLLMKSHCRAFLEVVMPEMHLLLSAIQKNLHSKSGK